MSRFQINSKIIFLTYPHCDQPKEDLYEFLCSYESPKVLQVLVAREKHSNGLYHLHAVAKFETSYRTTNPQEFDFRGSHGNYQPARSFKNVLKYCTKEDDYVANFDVGEMLGVKTTEKEALGKRILAGEDLVKIVQEHPKFLFGYTKLKTDVEELKNDMFEFPDLCDQLPNPWGLAMPVDTDNKKCHYWVYSTEPNHGKTSGFILPLYETYKACLFDPSSTYHKVSENTKMILIDELVPKNIKFNILNKMCDGTYEYRVIYKGDIRLKSKPIVVVCSNFSIERCFGIASKFIHARFTEYCLD